MHPRWRRMVAAGLALACLVPAGAGAAETALQRKLRTIVVDRLELEEAPLPEVVALLRARAKALDPEHKGVNLVLLAPRDPAEPVPAVTIMLDEVPLGEVLRYICTSIDYVCKVEDFVVVIAPKSRGVDPMATRQLPVRAETVREIKDGK